MSSEERTGVEIPEGVVPPEETERISNIEEPLRVTSIRPVFTGTQLQQLEPRSEAVERTRPARPAPAGPRVTLTGMGGEGVRLGEAPLTQLQPLTTEPTTREAIGELAQRGLSRLAQYQAQTARGARQVLTFDPSRYARLGQVRGVSRGRISSADEPSIFVDQERHPEHHLGDERHADVFTHPSGIVGYATGDIIEGQEVHEVGPGDQPLDQHRVTAFTDFGPYYELHPVDEDYDIWTGFHVPKVDHDIRDNYDIYTGWHGQRAKNDKKSFLDIPYPGELDQLEYERELEQKRQQAGLPPSRSVVNADYVGGRTMAESAPPISEPLIERVARAPQMLPEVSPMVSPVAQVSSQAPLPAGTVVSETGAQATGLTGEDLPADIKARIAATGGVDFYRVVGRNYVLRSKVPLRSTRLIRTQYGSQKQRRGAGPLGAIDRAERTAGEIA